MTQREKELLVLAARYYEAHDRCNPDVGWSIPDGLFEINKELTEPFTEKELANVRKNTNR